MARDGVWEVQVQSDEAIEKGPRLNEDSSGLGFKLRFKTGEYAKDADAEKPTPASLGKTWL